MARNQIRIIVGSYEHNILCLSLDLSLSTPIFTPIFHFQAHTLSVKCMDVSNRYLISGSHDEHIRIYDLQKRKELGTLLSHQGSITSLKFSRKVINSNNEDETQLAKPGAEGKSKWLFSTAEDHKILIWRVKDWEDFGVLRGHTARVNDIDIHPSNRIAVSVSEDHTVRLWNLMTIKKAAVLKLRGYPQNGQFVRWVGSEGKYFAVALLNKVLLYDSSTAKVSQEIDVGKRTIMHLETMRWEGQDYIVVGLSNGAVAFYTLDSVLNSEEKEPEFSLQGHANRVKDFKPFTNEFGTYFIAIGSDGKIVVWDLKSKEQLAIFDSGERLNCLAVCNESVEKESTMKKRDATTAEIDEQSEAEGDEEELKKVLFGEKKGKKKSKKAKKHGKKKVSVHLE
ncbi:ZYRO0D00616p [Zygosaccharomyces rouxii]|uniref:ZYRO0D00616p n=1 Tax=Zygosaccharomyces rouxii (strain ATCC 2623 / CBS 732 / NBRC 1130 / NCYC 568 / NRRL Y-229) TaxID=559307 RepID=C5DUQ9_ZYGRC|nr:uncharacterized protein ZYRO0D00616g [Zygosaccharomyces rouxii]KAH9200445.1 WD40-repeat-containing domain protein [Zygosaccharomyces rouxii]CAR27528.1 ZYRO0D00616p [Zygosaccharomyces rouxii]